MARIFLTGRGKGESFANWCSRERDAQIRDWRYVKMLSGDWLPQKEYERQTGQRGRRD